MTLIPTTQQDYCLLIPENRPDTCNPQNCTPTQCYNRRRPRRRSRIKTESFDTQECFTSQSCGAPGNCSGFNTPYSYTPNCQTPQQVTNGGTPNCCNAQSQPCSPPVRCRRRRRRFPRKKGRNHVSPLTSTKQFPSIPSNIGTNPSPPEVNPSSSMQFVGSNVGVTQFGGHVGSGQVTQSCTVLDAPPGCDYPPNDALPLHSPSGAFTPRSCDFSRSPSPIPLRLLNQVSGCSAVQNLCKSPPPRPPPPNFLRNCRLPCQGPPPRPPPPKPCGRKPPCFRQPSPCMAVGRQMRNSCCCSPTLCYIPTSPGLHGSQPIMFSIGQNGCCYPMQQSSGCPKTLYLIEKSFRMPNCCSQQPCYPPESPYNFPQPPPGVYKPPVPGIYRPPPPGTTLPPFSTSPPPMSFPLPSPFSTVFVPPPTPKFSNPGYGPPPATSFSYPPPPPFIPNRTTISQPNPEFSPPSLTFGVPTVPNFGVGTPTPSESFPPPPGKCCCCKPRPSNYGCSCRPSQQDTCCSTKPSQCDTSCATSRKSLRSFGTGKSRPNNACSRSNCRLSPSGRISWVSRPVTPCGSGSCHKARLPTPDPYTHTPSTTTKYSRYYRPPPPIYRRTPSFDPSYFSRSPSRDPGYSRSPSFDPSWRKSPSYSPGLRQSPSSNPCPTCPCCDLCCGNPCDDCYCCCPPIPKPCPPGSCTTCSDPCCECCDPCQQPVICCCPCKKKKRCVPEEPRIIVKQCFNTCPVCDPCECIRRNEASSCNKSCCCCGSIQQGVDFSCHNQPNRCLCCPTNCKIPYRNYSHCYP